MRLSPRWASGQIRLAEALAVRLPRVAALLEHGVISARVAAAIVYRTELVDSAAQIEVDAEIADRAGDFTTLSESDLDLAIDAVIEELDPDAVRRFRKAAKSCDVQFGKLDDATGTKSLFGRLLAVDAEVAFRVLNAMAATVCRDDPRSKGELRAAGYGAVFRGQDRFFCQCGNPSCVAATIPSQVPSVIIPTALLAELIRTGATLRPLLIPVQEPEPRYRFSASLRQFVQFRDLLCRFPGCNRKAHYADVDHTTAHADGGPTHASNAKALCREHHLAKTFRGGPNGWRDEQLPDGSVIWTAPTGHSYLTEPTTRLVFTDWNPPDCDAAATAVQDSPPRRLEYHHAPTQTHPTTRP